MKQNYSELLNRIEIFKINHGHSVDVVIRNSKGKEVYSTMFSRNKRARIVNNIALTLELCAELAKYNALNLEELYKQVEEAIRLYNKGNVDIAKRADIIKQYCLDVAEDMDLDLLFNAYGLFDLYSRYNEEEIAITYNFICDKISMFKYKYNDLLPSSGLNKYKGKEQ